MTEADDATFITTAVPLTDVAPETLSYLEGLPADERAKIPAAVISPTSVSQVPPMSEEELEALTAAEEAKTEAASPSDYPESVDVKPLEIVTEPIEPEPADYKSSYVEPVSDEEVLEDPIVAEEVVEPSPPIVIEDDSDGDE